MMTKRKPVFLGLLLGSVLLEGCALNQGTAKSYVDNTYQVGSIKRLALFPIRNASRAPSEARSINVRLAQAIAKKNPDLELVSPARSLELINDAGLADKWADFVEDYYTSGIANQKILAKVGEALQVDAVLQADIVSIYQSDGSGGRKGISRVTVVMSIIEASSGRRVWEITADGVKEDIRLFYDVVGSPAPPIEEVIELAVVKILGMMPRL